MLGPAARSWESSRVRVEIVDWYLACTALCLRLAIPSVIHSGPYLPVTTFVS